VLQDYVLQDYVLQDYVLQDYVLRAGPLGKHVAREVFHPLLELRELGPSPLAPAALGGVAPPLVGLIWVVLVAERPPNYGSTPPAIALGTGASGH
jgi:hypothetical protein